MNYKIIIVVVVFAIFSGINLFIKLIGYSYKASKFGINTKATFIGYYVYYDLQNIMWYPVVRFQNMNGTEITARSKCLLALPIYKVGDEIDIKYYSENFDVCENKEIYTNRFTTQKKEVTINTKVNFNILDIKHLLDSIIEVCLIITFLIIILNK